jgi:hypothetical protein
MNETMNEAMSETWHARAWAQHYDASKLLSHCNKALNSKFTVPKNSRFHRCLGNGINCVAIVAPYGTAMVTVLRTPARPNVTSTSHVYTWS